MASTTAMAAFSMRRIDGTPKRSVARRSMLRICSESRIFMIFAVGLTEPERERHHGCWIDARAMSPLRCEGGHPADGPAGCRRSSLITRAQETGQFPFAARAGVPSQVLGYVDIRPQGQHGHSAPPLPNPLERLSEHAIGAPFDFVEDGGVKRRVAAADQVVPAIDSRTDDPLAGVEKRKGLIDCRATEPRILDAHARDFPPDVD